MSLDFSYSFRRIWDFMIFLSNTVVFIIDVILSGIAGYFAFKAIQGLPKPETFIELAKFYFKSPDDYGKAILLTLIASVFIIFAGFAIIAYSIKLADFHNVIRIILFILGVAVIFGAFYFFGYFISLIFVILTIGAIAAFLLSNSSSNR